MHPTAAPALSLRSLLLSRLCAASAACAMAVAQLPVVHLNGPVFDGAGGPFVTGVVYHIVSNGASCCASVPAGQTLTIQPGAVVKLDVSINVLGTLIADGATFTSYHDDSIGGDSNLNGNATQPQPGNWQQIEFSGPGSVVQDCLFRYGGGSGSSGSTVWTRNAPVTIRRCTIEHSLSSGIDLAGQATVVEDSVVRFCGGRALQNGWFPAVVDLRNITAHSNAGGNYAHFLYGGGTWPAAVRVQPMHSVNGSGVHVLETFSGSGSNPVIVGSGSTLTLDPGTILKFVRGSMEVRGTLLCNGTQLQPVVFTSLEDDAHGGDTNLDGGATQPTPGDWSGLSFTAGGGASRCDHTKFLHGGSALQPAVYCNGAGATFEDCEIARAAGDAFQHRPGTPGTATLLRCLLRDNGGLGWSQAQWQDLQASRDVALQGNGGGDHVTIAGGNLTQPIDGLLPANVPATLLLEAPLAILAGGSLTIPAGTVLKMATNVGITASGGPLRLLGSGDAPIVIASVHDDSIGGDTNRNGGATAPAPGDWSRIACSAPGCRLEHVQLRHGGRQGAPCLDVAAADTAVRAAHVAFASGDGVEIDVLTQSVVDLVVHGCGGDGVELRSGTFDLVHATIADNAGAGVRRTGQLGQIRNSIVWNNAGGNFVGVAAGGVLHSCGGFAGQNGNLATDPQFAATTPFDYRLAATSPCLGAADLGAAFLVAADADERSRVADHALTGAMAADMGAYERAAFRMVIQGAPRLGQSLTFTLQGPPGFGGFLLGFLEQTVPVPPYGVELVGLAGAGILGGLVTTGQGVTLAIPSDPTFAGFRFGVQGLGISGANPTAGNFTNRYRALLH